MAMVSIRVDMSPVLAYVANAAKSVPAVYAAARDAVEYTTAGVENRARELAPERTGTLKASIQSSVGGLQGRVFTDLRYAPYVEFGTAQHGGPQPFLIPAAEEWEKKYVAIMEEKVLPVVLKYLG